LCLQQLWDFVRVIESCIVDWHTTPWLRIDTDDMEHECKKFTRDLRTLDKCIRDWAPYVYIVGVLRELVASLRAVTELQNPAITERHWLELMQLSKVSKTKGAANDVCPWVTKRISLHFSHFTFPFPTSPSSSSSLRSFHMIGLDSIV